MFHHHHEKAAPPETQTLPHRQATGGTSDDEAVPDLDLSDVCLQPHIQHLVAYCEYLQTSGLLLERLQAWKHACGYLENYISATEKMHKSHAKEYEKILKVSALMQGPGSQLLIPQYRRSQIL